MGNVIRFPKRPEMPQLVELGADSFKATIGPPHLTLPGVLGWLWSLRRLPLFLVLYWLRQPIVGLCNLFSPLPCWRCIHRRAINAPARCVGLRGVEFRRLCACLVL